MSMKECELILQKTDGGLAVFRHYLGERCLKKTFKSPFREETSPSCHLYLNKRFGTAYYYLQDFGDRSCCGDCFTVVAHLLNMNTRSDFVTLLKTIDHDMCLGVFEDSSTSCEPRRNAPLLEHASVKPPAQTVDFVPQIQEFSRGEMEYWQRYGIGLDTLQKYHVHSLRSVTFSKSDGKSFCIFGTQACPAFGYFFNDMKGMKVYRPKAKSRFMYAGKLPQHEVSSHTKTLRHNRHSGVPQATECQLLSLLLDSRLHGIYDTAAVLRNRTPEGLRFDNTEQPEQHNFHDSGKRGLQQVIRILPQRQRRKHAR